MRSAIQPTITPNSFILYKFSTGMCPNLNINASYLKPDNSPVCISHSIRAKIHELHKKAKIPEQSSMIEYEQPYHHLVSAAKTTSTICKLPLSLFFLELVELVKINYLKNDLEMDTNTVLFVNESLEKITEFMSMYRTNNSSLNVYATKLYDKEEMLSGYNAMDFIFINRIGRMDYQATLNLIQTHQKDNGMLIVKTSDLFYKQSIEFIHILNSMYQQIIFIQPSISSLLNGDKFIVCKNKKRKHKMSNATKVGVSEDVVNTNAGLEPLLNWPIYLLNKMEDMNIYFGKRQLENIQQYIENTGKCVTSITAATNVALTNTNKYKCIQWCKNFQMPIIQPNI